LAATSRGVEALRGTAVGDAQGVGDTVTSYSAFHEDDTVLGCRRQRFTRVRADVGHLHVRREVVAIDANVGDEVKSLFARTAVLAKVLVDVDTKGGIVVEAEPGVTEVRLIPSVRPVGWRIAIDVEGEA
jgi:hypothetical protein